MNDPHKSNTCVVNSLAHLVLRRASILDLDTIVEFNIASANDQEEHRLSHIKVRWAVRLTLSASAIGQAGCAFYLLALWEERAVGQLRIQPTRFDGFASEFWQVQHVYVKPEFRRMGICRAMLQEAQRLATLNGAGNLHLFVDKANSSARRAYERGGFQPLNLDLMVLEIGGISS